MKTITMQKYKKDFLISRNIDEYDFIKCEMCGAEANDIHHLHKSMRGRRKNKKDGTDLIALCRKHHLRIHANNTQKNMEFCLAIVKEIVIL